MGPAGCGRGQGSLEGLGLGSPAVGGYSRVAQAKAMPWEAQEIPQSSVSGSWHRSPQEG